ncbi:MAG: VTT domain-containing protein [Candidatus Woesearchaeota archaeon]
MIKIKKFFSEHKKLIIFVIILFSLSTAFFLLQPFILKIIKNNPGLYSIYNYIIFQINNKSILWLLIISFFGSIFIISIPVEMLFLYYIMSESNIFLSIMAATIGTICARCVNFYIGTKFKHLSEHITKKDEFSKKKFNKTQSSLLFIGNFIPAFPIEHFAVFVGTTHYDFKKFLIYQIIAKTIKLILIVVFLKFLIINLQFLNISFYDIVKKFLIILLDLII